MYYISNGVLYTSPNIKFAEVLELNERNLKKIILKKDILTFSTFCFRDAKKKKLKELLELESIKRILEAKEITYKMRYIRYYNKSYLIFTMFIRSVEYEVSKINFFE